MTRSRTFPAAALALAALLVLGALAAPLFGTDALAEKEELACTVCHDKPGSKLLTDRGKYYELAGTLVGYAEIKASFGACTSCHARKPGSHELTTRGEQLREVLRDMDGLRAHVMQEHPKAP